jgi:hypothetical protein
LAASPSTTIKEAVRVAPPNNPEIVAAPEPDVVTVNPAVVLPAGTLTDPGTDAADELLDKLTAAPPVGATPLSATVPCTGLGEVTVGVPRLRELSVTICRGSVGELHAYTAARTAPTDARKSKLDLLCVYIKTPNSAVNER